MKRLFLALFLLFGLSLSAQVTNSCNGQPCALITSSGGTLVIPNVFGGMNAAFEELLAGSPASSSIAIQGCMRGGTCDTAMDTNATNAAAAIRSVVPTSKPYSYFLVTATWSGGTNVSVGINPVITTARAGSGGGSGVASINTVTGAFTFTGSGVNCVTTTCTFTGGTLTFPATVAGTVNSGGIPFFSGATTMSSSGLLIANAVVIGGGAGLTPATIAADTTTTHALFATAGAPAFRALAAGDLPTTLTSGTAITNAALTTPTLGTPASGTLTNTTGYKENVLTGATAAGTITEAAASDSVTRAGVETAALTFPWVFTNLNSTNNNSSGVVAISAPGTSTGQIPLSVNGASTSAALQSWTTGAAYTNGVQSGATTVAQMLPTGALTLGTAPTVTTPGTGNYIFGTQGTEPASVGASTSGFVMDSGLTCPVVWNNAAKGGCVDFNPVAVAGTNAAGTAHLVQGGLGTGNAAIGPVKIQTGNFSTTSGSTAQTQVTRLVTWSKAGSTTSATATNMFNIAVAASQTIGVEVIVHVETTQATPQNCSTTENFIASVQNTAATITQQTTAGTIGTICSTGTLTLAAAFSAATPSVFSVTPSWTTIVPTGVIITVEVHNLSQQDITLL